MNGTSMTLALNILFALVMPFTHIAGYAAAGIGMIAGSGKLKELRTHPVFPALLLFIAYGSIRSVYSPDPMVGYKVMGGYFMHWLAPFALGFSLVNASQVKKAAGTYLLTFTVLVFFSVLAYFGLFYRELGPQHVLAAEGLLKALHSHITLGALCLIASFMSLGQALRHDMNVRCRTAFAAGTVFFLIALVLTGSRGYYIGALAAYCFFGIYWTIRTGRWKIMALCVCAGIIVISGLYAAVPGVQNRVHRTGAKDSNIVERLAMYRVASAEIKDRPAFGFGPGQAVLQTRYYAILPPEMRDVQQHGHLHSMYLQLAADFGLAGLAVFLAVMFFVLKDCIRLSHSTDIFVQSMGITMVFIVIGILTGECFDTLLRGPGVAMQFFWLAGMAAAAARRDRENRQA